MAKAIMIQGTMSNVGKSIVAAALCRIFRQDGYRVAPFKAQNMALNSFITADGLEMGRAQVVQAEAAGILPDVRMNPLLLKPTSDQGSQVIVMGKSTGNMRAKEFYRIKHTLRPVIKQAFDSLAEEYDIIVIEGAGSPAEINLKQDDLVNMGMAKMAGAPVLLIGDIDRGGVFASLYGTSMLLEPEEQDRIKGLIINKFRGDVDILRPGLSMIEEKLQKPVLGVVPYAKLDIDDEDSLSERMQPGGDAPGLICIAVPKLPRISNFTDLNVLARVPGVRVSYADKPEQLLGADMVVIPGSKNTVGDLKWLRQSGLEAQIKKLSAAGIPILGICGGYQMMGEWLSDPGFAEEGGEIAGMGLLPVRTVFAKEKETRQVSGRVNRLSGFFACLSDEPFAGYEIHMGTSAYTGEPAPMLTKADGTPDGCQQGNCYGTYVHGILDRAASAAKLADALFISKGMPAGANHVLDTATYKEREYDKLADLVRGALNMEKIYQILEAGV